MEYLSYPTTTQVKIYVPLTFRPPAVSLCVIIYDIYDLNSMNTSDREEFIEEDCMWSLSEKCLSVLHRSSIATIMSNLTYGIVDRKSEMHYIEYYKLLLKCVKYMKTENPNKKLRVGQIDDMHALKGSLIEVSIDENVQKMNKSYIVALLFIHDSRTLAHLRECNVKWLNGGENIPNYNTLSFDQVETENLPFPYKTNCIDYDLTNFSSQGDCVEHCYDEKYEKHYGENTGLITSSNYSILKLRTKYRLAYDMSMDESCYLICPISCRTHKYFVVPVGTFNVAHMKSWINVDIGLSRPFNRVRLIKSFDLNSYIIFMASAAGLWLGCSLFVTVGDIINFIYKSVKHFKE